MSDTKRRDFLKATAGVAAGGALGAGSALWTPRSGGADVQGRRRRRAPSCACCAGSASCRATRTCGRRTRRSSPQMTGIEVRVDAEGWEDVRPKAAVAANVGSGPDIIISTMEDAHQYPEKLVDVSDLANYLGNKYGGWYPLAKDYAHARQQVGGDHDGRGRQRDRLPRKRSEGRRASTRVPRDMAGFLKLCQALKAKGTPAGLRARQRDRRLELDALARVGARRQAGRRQEQRRHQQPGDDRRARVLEAAVRDVHPGHAVVARPEQQQGVPRRPALPHRQRHLGLLRGEDVAGPEDAGDGQRHPARVLPGRCSTASRAS